MTTDVRYLARAHPFRPALDLVLLILVSATAGAALLTFRSTGALAWIDGASRSVVALHVHEGLNQTMVAVTSLGAEIALIAAFGTLAVWSYRWRGLLWGRFFAVVGIGALTLDNIVKPLVGRPRPVFDQLVGGRGDSFPSGHATATTALLFAVAWYLSSRKESAARKPYWYAAAAGAILMGISRIYVGVHWPTDVIAGSLLGGGWTWMCVRSQLGRRAAPAHARSWTARRRTLALVVTLVFVGLACSPTSETSTTARAALPTSSALDRDVSGETYRPDIRPKDFVMEIDNPYLPLVPGTVFELRGETGDGIERETITVTRRTREVMGVRTTVVKDVARVDGEVAEFTYDWYAQDEDGNVWYFGENTAEIENGKVLNRHGSWEAGIEGAQPGIIMDPDPQVLDSFRQEYYAGEAEDMFWVVADHERVSVPAGTYDDAIRALEWNPLEPKVIVEKFYAPGVGLVAERALSGGKEVVELLSVTRP